MLCLILQIGEVRYALEVSQVVEVLPLVRVRPLTDAAPGVAGLMIYRGTPVPVIDLCRLALGQPAPARLSTRIVLLHRPDATAHGPWFGLIVEHATETRRFQPADFVPTHATASHSSAVATDALGLLHKLDLESILQRLALSAIHPRQPEPAETPAWASPASKSF